MKRFVVLVLGLLACGKNSPGAPAPSVSPGDALPAAVASSEVDGEAMEPALADLWGRAKEGDPADLMRLADREGSVGLVERASDPALRLTALRALGFARDFVGLPLLADVAAGDNDEEARAALQSAVDLAASRRTARDPEDAAELKDGCDKLVFLARDAARPKPRRVLAVDALRMLAERGCVKREEIPPIP